MVSLIANGSEIMIGRLHSKTNCNSYQAINDLRHIFFNLLFILTSSEFHIILKSLGRRRSFRKINYLYRGFSGQCHHVSQQQSRSDKPVHYENAVGYHRYSFISGEGTVMQHFHCKEPDSLIGPDHKATLCWRASKILPHSDTETELSQLRYIYKVRQDHTACVF